MRLTPALLATAFALAAATGQAQLLPAGKFAARDGRPGAGKQWGVNDAQGLKLAASINAIAAKTPIVIDYDHQTLHAEKNGQLAPAAGWIKSVEWLAGKGLFATVEWTPAAKARIEAGEYRYISPVITADEDGVVVDVHLAALLNHPALLGMDAAMAQLQARFDSNVEPQDMKTLLAALIPLLALAASATDDDAVKAVEALKTKANAKPGLPTALSTALALKADADEAQALSAIEALKGGDKGTTALVASLQQQVVALSAQLQGDKVKQLLDDAVERQLMLPTQRPLYEDIGKKNFEQLQALVKGMEPLAGLRGQSNGKDHGGGDNTDAEALAAKASAYQQEQAKLGITVNSLQAVAHVSRTA